MQYDLLKVISSEQGTEAPRTDESLHSGKHLRPRKVATRFPVRRMVWAASCCSWFSCVLAQSSPAHKCRPAPSRAGDRRERRRGTRRHRHGHVAEPSGPTVTVTSDNGDYAIPLLPPGDYTVTFELSGFRTVRRTVSVAGTQTVPLDVELSIAEVTETVQVTADASPFLDTAQVATNIRQELMATLPTSRTMVAAVLMAPNARATGPGGQSAPTGRSSISGAMSFDSLYLINGVAVTENLRGQPFTLFIEDAIQETTVATGGISAEYGRFGGGMVNVITKSGGNDFSGSFRLSFNNDDWRATTPFRRDQARQVTIPTYEYTIGGPVVRDRLWFFTAGRFRESGGGATDVRHQHLVSAHGRREALRGQADLFVHERADGERLVYRRSSRRFSTRTSRTRWI